MKNLLIRTFKNIDIMLVSIGIVYLWFGILKFFPSVSPAEELAKNTIYQITFGLIPSQISYYTLAIWETSVGMMLLLGIFKRYALILALVHMFFTFTPLILFPDISFKDLPFSFTIIGQYILKNIIIISAILVLLKKYKKKTFQTLIS